MDGGVYALTLDSGMGFGFACPVQPIVRNGRFGEMHIAKAGEWKGHPTGEFQFDAKLFDALIARFDARESRALLVDYSHKSERSGEPDDIRASGWIRSLYRKGEGDQAELWAKVEFTQRASEMITAGELLFCSPVVAWDVPDTRSGKAGPELISAALTNQPFQDHLKAIALSRTALAFPPPKAKAKADGETEEPEPDAADPAEGEEPAGEEPAPGEQPQDGPPPEPDGNTPPADDQAADPLLAIATELGIDRATVCAVVDANVGVFVKAIGDALEKQRKEQTMATPQTQAPAAPTQLSADQRISALEKQLADDRIAHAKSLVLSRVDALIADGYGTQDMRDYMIFEFSKDPAEAAKKFADKVVPVGEMQAGNRDQVKHKAKLTELSAEDRVWHDAVVKARIMKSDEALNRIVARREAAGKAA